MVEINMRHIQSAPKCVWQFREDLNSVSRSYCCHDTGGYEMSAFQEVSQQNYACFSTIRIRSSAYHNIPDLTWLILRNSEMKNL
jgi:hypothetical protein